MIITIVSDAKSWKNGFIPELRRKLQALGHRVHWVHRSEDIRRGELTLILGFFKILPPAALAKNKHNLVIHESALPKGRGWSPVHWQVIEGARSIPLSMFEALERVDAGSIYLRARVPLEGTELLTEIQDKLAPAFMKLCLDFVRRYPGILKRGQRQRGKPTYYPRRSPPDSELDPRKTLAEQFNLLRVCDPVDYPAFFTIRGKTFYLRLEPKQDQPR